VVEKRFPWMKDEPVAETPVVQSSEADTTAADAPPAEPAPPPAKKKKPIYKFW
jgi:hypothetical protein